MTLIRSIDKGNYKANDLFIKKVTKTLDNKVKSQTLMTCVSIDLTHITLTDDFGQLSRISLSTFPKDELNGLSIEYIAVESIEDYQP